MKSLETEVSRNQRKQTDNYQKLRVRTSSKECLTSNVASKAGVSAILFTSAKWTEQKDIAAGNGSSGTVGGDHKENSHKRRHALDSARPSRPVIGRNQHSRKTKDEPQRQNTELLFVWNDLIGTWVCMGPISRVH